MRDLEDLIKDIRSSMSARDLSDGYLSENGNSTRDEIGIGEYSYGISMIPCSWVIKHLENYLKLKNNLKGAIDSSIYADAHEYGNMYMVSTDILEEVLEKSNEEENKNDE